MTRKKKTASRKAKAIGVTTPPHESLPDGLHRTASGLLDRLLNLRRELPSATRQDIGGALRVASTTSGQRLRLARNEAVDSLDELERTPFGNGSAVDMTRYFAITEGAREWRSAVDELPRSHTFQRDGLIPASESKLLDRAIDLLTRGLETEEGVLEAGEERGRAIASAKAARRSPGRPQKSNLADDKKLVEDWKASGMARYADFEKVRGLEPGSVQRATDRVKQANRRAARRKAT